MFCSHCLKLEVFIEKTIGYIATPHKGKNVYYNLGEKACTHIEHIIATN